MKSLILKDLYNIAHNARSTALMLLFLAACYTVFGSPGISLYMCCHLCCMMVVTTFSFDCTSQWEPYALIMPVSRRDLVAGKFAVLFIFSVVGTLAGVVLFLLSAFFSSSAAFEPDFIYYSLAASFLCLPLCQIANGLSIPLLFQFGTENTRIVSILSSGVLIVLSLGIFGLLPRLGLDVQSASSLLVLACLSALLALAWNYGMYRISCRIFEEKDL